MTGRGLLAIVASLVVLGAVATGLWINGTPGYQRALAEDERRAAILTGLATRLDYQVSRYGALPDQLMEVATEEQRVDPVTHQPVEYTHKGTDYRLCAVFAMASEGGSGGELPFRRHAKGRTCFDQSAAVKAQASPSAGRAHPPIQ